MARYIGFRILAVIPLLLAVTVIAFLIAVAMEARGSIAITICGEGAGPDCIEQVESELGLDKPVVSRFADWFGNAIQGDLGTSLTNQNITVSSLISERIWPTLSLVGFSLLIGVTFGMVLGVLAGIRPGGKLDRFLSIAAASSIAAPGFIIAMLLSWVVAVKWGWLDPVGYTPLTESFTGWLKSITLPSLSLALPTLAIVQRQLRSAMTNALQSRYVLAARARGVSQAAVIGRHALPNAMIPTVTAIGFRAAAAIGLTFTVEIVFGIRGMGSLLVEAIVDRNVTVLQGAMVLVGIVVVLVNLLVDVSYGYLNPKVRLNK